MAHPTGHFAVYGQVRIQREFCQRCGCYALVVGGKLQCCDARVELLDESAKRKRMSDVAGRRLGPSAKYRKHQLEEQEYRCFYCLRPFGKHVYRGRRIIVLKLHWDHIDPFAFSLNNKDLNFVAACHICNGIKGAFTFTSIEEARIEIQARWTEKGYQDDMPELSVRIPAETQMAKILQPSLSAPKLV